MARKKLSEMTEEERAARIREREASGRTQGAAGAYMGRATIAFTPANYQLVRAVSKAGGISQAKFVNQVLDEYRAAHPDLMAKAEAFVEAFTGETLDGMPVEEPAGDAGEGDA